MEINTKGLQEKKRILAGEIYNFIREKTISFKSETGLCVKEIYVVFEEVTSLSDEYPQSVPSNVLIRLSPEL